MPVLGEKRNPRVVHEDNIEDARLRGTGIGALLELVGIWRLDSLNFRALHLRVVLGSGPKTVALAARWHEDRDVSPCGSVDREYGRRNSQGEKQFAKHCTPPIPSCYPEVFFVGAPPFPA